MKRGRGEIEKEAKMLKYAWEKSENLNYYSETSRESRLEGRAI
jgi:hypothetical protein